jgi:hypothetical protein
MFFILMGQNEMVMTGVHIMDLRPRQAYYCREWRNTGLE